MKILHVTDRLLPLPSGVIERQLSRVQAQAGHQVAIYTSDFELDQEHIDSLEGVEVYPFRNFHSPRVFEDITPGMIFGMRKEIKNFDILHLHSYVTFQNVVACHYARKYNIPYVLHAHGGATREWGNKWVHKIYDIAFGYRILGNAAKIIAVSNVEIETYKQLGVNENKIAHIPTGLDIESFDNLPEPGQFRKRIS